MNCPICGANMTEFEKKTFDNRCADCHSDVWAAKNIGEKQSIEQVENMIKIFKDMRRKEHDEMIKNSYNAAINSYKRQLKELKKSNE
jgi:primosomal protein N'